MRRWTFFFFILAFGLASPVLWAASFSVVFINPGRAEEPYWRSVTRFMQPAAQQLDIQLEVLYAERDSQRMIELAKQVTQRVRKPDYLVIVNEKRTAGEMLKMAEQARIKTLIAFSTFENDDVAEFGVPRQKYRYWLGSISPNAVTAGRLTAAELVRQAVKLGAMADDGKVHVALIAGDNATPTSVQRTAGAVSTFTGNPTVALEEIVYADFDRAQAKKQAHGLLQRYPKLNAIWTASDLMAYGAMEAAEAVGRKPGKDLLFSAVNNSPEVLQALIQGRISALAGGHFATGAWSLVMLYDYHHSVDFATEGLELRRPLFSLFDEDMARRFLQRFGSEDFSSIDFRQFSKHLHPQIRNYEFSFSAILK